MPRPVRGRSARRSRSPKSARRTARGSASCCPWLVLAPVFLRERATGRALIEHALEAARARAAVGALPFLLNLVARDQATTDRWAVAEATHIETIQLARESGQHVELTFALANHAWLQARRGREEECRRARGRGAERWPASSALALYEIWATAALGELALALGQTEAAVAEFEREQELIERCGITDPDVIAGSRAGRGVSAPGPRRRRPSASRSGSSRLARAKGQPWSLARALRCRAMLAGDADYEAAFDGGSGRPRADAGRVPDRPHPPRLRRAPAALAPPGPGPRAATSRAGDVRAPRCRPVGRARPGRARRLRRDAPPPRPDHARRPDPAGAADRAPPGRGQDDPRSRGGPVPQPQDGRVPPPPRLPEARDRLTPRAGPGPRRDDACRGVSQPFRVRLSDRSEAKARASRRTVRPASRPRPAPTTPARRCVPPAVSRAAAERHANFPRPCPGG